MSIRVLHVDDEPDFCDLASTFIERQDERLNVETATSPSDGLDRLAENGFDCIVSDYDMPGEDGIEFLEAVRESHPDLPFILYTGKGSEEVAAEAISKGVTDYLQKESGTSQYSVLANRISNAVEMHRTERNLRASEERYRRLLEAAPVPILLYSENLEIVHLNGAAVDFLNADSREQLIGKHATEFAHPDNEDRVQTRLEQVTTERVPTGPAEAQVLTEDGSVKYIIASSAPGTYDGKAVVQTVAYDITEQKERQEELQEERDRYEALFEAVPEPAVRVRFDDENRPIVKEVNAAFEDVFGYQEARMKGQDIDEFIIPDRLSEEAQEIADRTASGAQVHREVRRQTADGERDFLFQTKPLDLAGEFREAIGIYVGLTEQKSRERALEKSRERFRSIAETATDAILTIDTNSTIQFANPAVERILGYEPEEVEGESLTMLMPERYRDRHRAALQRYLDTGDRSLDWTSVEMPGVHKDGHEIDLQISFSEIEVDGENRFTGIIRV